MNSVLFAKVDQVFSKENKTLKKYWKFGKNTGKVREKSGNFVSPEKVDLSRRLCIIVGRLLNFPIGSTDLPSYEMYTSNLSWYLQSVAQINSLKVENIIDTIM